MVKSRYLFFAVDLAMLVGVNLPLGNHPAAVAVLPVLMMIGIYALRSFDLASLASGDNTVFRVFMGALLGLIPFYLAYPFLHGAMQRITIPYNILLCTLLLGLAHKFIYPRFLRSYPKTKYLLVGDRTGLAPILEDIAAKAFSRLEFTDSPAGDGYDAVLVLDPKSEPGLSGDPLPPSANGHTAVYLPMLCESYLKRIPIEVVQRNPGYYRLALESVSDEPLTRILDVIVSVVLLLLASPLFVLASMLILMEDGRPIHFEQQRIGRHGAAFVIHKLRTLRDTGINETNPNVDIEERSLKVGKVLRRTRLDEIPNLVNVLKGEMSIVGPRPEMPQFHESARRSIPFYSYRLQVRPGITGWAQLCYKHTSSMDDYKTKTEYDLYYIKNRNTLLDLKIMLKTFETMIGRRGR